MQLEDGDVGPGALVHAKWLRHRGDSRVLFVATVPGGGSVRNTLSHHYSETALVLLPGEARIMTVFTALLSSRPSTRSAA